jgi:hypothetical protein
MSSLGILPTTLTKVEKLKIFSLKIFTTSYDTKVITNVNTGVHIRNS